MDTRQLANVQEINWRKCNGHSPIGECTGDKLAKVHWTLAIGESPIYESLIGEVPATPQDMYLEVFEGGEFESGVHLPWNLIGWPKTNRNSATKKTAN
jgi:hypothetical protein